MEHTTKKRDNMRAIKGVVWPLIKVLFVYAACIGLTYAVAWLNNGLPLTISLNTPSELEHHIKIGSALIIATLIIYTQRHYYMNE